MRNREYLLIKVDDDGPGVDECARKDILRRGTRLDETVQGHGMGLASVSDIVSQYNGTIELEDSPALSGLCVCLSLPVKPIP